MSERVITYAEALHDALQLEMRNDPNVFILGEDMGKYGGIFGVSKGLLDEFETGTCAIHRSQNQKSWVCLWELPRWGYARCQRSCLVTSWQSASTTC